MKPSDENGHRPTAERPFRVLVISGSDRRQFNCPGVDSKSRALMLRMAERLPQDWEIDYEDLGNVFGREKIQSCNACASTSMALCVWPCLPASERVLGRTVRGIAELRPGDTVATGRVTHAWMSSPAAPVYRLRLSDGRTVRLTANHPVLVADAARREKVDGAWRYVRRERWVPAGELRVGDRVPFPLGEECGDFGADSGLDPFLYLLAGLVFGDGSFAGAQQARLFFDQRAPAPAEEVHALSPFAARAHRQSYSARETGWPRTADAHMRHLAWDASVGGILCDTLGLDESVPVARRALPAAILNGSRTEVCAFLRGWFTTDGSVGVHGTKLRVSLASSSVPALRDAQILLAKLGVRSRVNDMSHRTVTTGGRECPRASTLQITKRAAVERFADVVGFLGEKAARLRTPVAHRGGRTDRDYGRVVSVEPDGIEPVYDITVEASHRFVAELVPVHNCNCYEKNNSDEPDLMWNLDLYARLDLADAWAIIGPINWYGPWSNLKLMFDRLVCMSGGNPDESTIDHKDPEKAAALEKTPEWEALSVNHLEGRTAGFFCYGDEGANEMGSDRRPSKLRHKRYFDPEAEPFAGEREAYAPLVWQSRFSGIEVPDELWAYCTTGKGRPYSDDQAEDMVRDAEFMAAFDRWTDAFAAFVGAKGKVEPGAHRAFGHKPGGHRWADAKLKWRAIRIGLGVPPAGSSPAEQQQLGLNDDATVRFAKSEGEKLRE